MREESDKRKFKMTLPLTDEEKNLVREKARNAGLTMSSYIRMCINNYNNEEAEGIKLNTIKLKDFARAIGVSLTRARNILLDREITFYKIDGEYRLATKDVDEYMLSVRYEKEAVEKSCEPLLTIREVAMLYNVTAQTVDNWIRKGYMPCVRIGPGGRYVRIRRQDINCMAVAYGIDEIQA